jgi:hypothetical protein
MHHVIVTMISIDQGFANCALILSTAVCKSEVLGGIVRQIHIRRTCGIRLSWMSLVITPCNMLANSFVISLTQEFRSDIGRYSLTVMGEEFFDTRIIIYMWSIYALHARHSAKAILHSAKPLPSVTLDKEHSAKGSLPSTFFGHSAKTLPTVKKHSVNKNTRQIKNRKNLKKTAKHFFKF